MSPQPSDDAAATPAAPVLRVVSGDPTPAEVAALVAVLAARGGGQAPAPEPERSAWASREAAHRVSLFPGPGAWRASAWR